jgi:rubrerythrin
MFTDASRIRTVPSLCRAYRESVKTGDALAASGMAERPIEGPAWDCPECGVKASVHDDVCDVCLAELDEFRLEPWDDVRDVANPPP